MDAVLLGLLAGALFGAMAVAIRAALLRGGDPGLGSVVISGAAFALVTALALPGALTDGVELEQLWRFALIGLVVPGVSQILMIFAIRHAGPSRAAILVGTAPLGSVLLAVGLLDEELRPALVAGTALIVAGGAALALDPGRPAGFRAVGVVLALVCAALFAGRDNAVRWVARDVDAPPAQAAAATLLASSLVAIVYVLATRRTTAVRRSARTTVPAFVPGGLFFGCAYAALVTGFDRGDVGIVAPLNATQSLWGVAFAALVYGQREAIGRRTVLASALIVLGGVLIGAFR
jgi:drug/metabolite transporter (DMT)-like permease